eukprot:gene19403-26060_t
MPKIVTICRIPFPEAVPGVSGVGHMHVTRQNHFSHSHHGDLVEKIIAGSLSQDVAWSKLVCHPVGEELDAFVQDIVHTVTKGLVWKYVALVPVELIHEPEDMDRESDGFDELLPSQQELLPKPRRTNCLRAASTPIPSADLWTSCGPPNLSAAIFGTSSLARSGTSGIAGVMPEDRARSNPNPTPKLESMLQLILTGSQSAGCTPVSGKKGSFDVTNFSTMGPELRGDSGHRSMCMGSGLVESTAISSGFANVSGAFLDVSNDSNTLASNKASSSTRCSTPMTAGSSNHGKSLLAATSAPVLAVGLPEDIPEEAPIVWMEVTIKTVTDHEEGMCSLMIIQEDVSERENALNQLCNLTEAQLTIMAETFPRHIIDYMSVSSPNKAPLVGELASSHKDVQATDVLTFLNELFTPFDHMCDLHDVQKMETAGDCYIVAAGIIEKQQETGFCNILEAHDPVHSATKVLAFAKSMISHAKTSGFCSILEGHDPVHSATEVLAFAKSMISHAKTSGFCSILEGHDPVHSATEVLAFAKSMISHAKTVVMPHNQQPVVIRVGMHTGPCVSGLIGTKLPKFSIFGDTMNTASRMESTCKPSLIQVSQDTHKLLVAGGNHDPWESTSGVEIKGKGLMNTFILDPEDLDFDSNPVLSQELRREPNSLSSLIAVARAVSCSGNGTHYHSEQMLVLSAANPGVPRIGSMSYLTKSPLQSGEFAQCSSLDLSNFALSKTGAGLSPFQQNSGRHSRFSTRRPVIHRPSQQFMGSVEKVGTLTPSFSQLGLRSEQSKAELFRLKEANIPTILKSTAMGTIMASLQTSAKLPSSLSKVETGVERVDPGVEALESGPIKVGPAEEMVGETHALPTPGTADQTEGAITELCETVGLAGEKMVGPVRKRAAPQKLNSFQSLGVLARAAKSNIPESILEGCSD